MAHIVLNPFGSLGDLHPYLALALGLRGRGHRVTVATCAVYKAKVEAEGLAFAPVRPDAGELLGQPALMKCLLDPGRGTEFLLRDYLIPRVREAFDDLLPVCRQADLLLTHVAAYAGPVVASHLKMPWLSVALQPSTLFSKHDLMTVPRAPWLRHLYWLGPRFTGLLLSIADRETRRWSRPILQLRRELALPADTNPVMWGQFSPLGTLALFSRHFAPPQADWPPHTSQPGFLFYDSLGAGLAGSSNQTGQAQAFFRWLANGTGPVVLFTLGSSAVLQPGDFYDVSLRAAWRLGVRAILLAGDWHGRESAGPDIFVAPYLPYSLAMSRVHAVVHAGGIGSTAQVLRAGVPSLVVPSSNDQPDNAHRLQRLGVANALPRSRYKLDAAVPLLRSLLASENARCRAASLAGGIRAEDSLLQACDAVDGVLHSNGL